MIPPTPSEPLGSLIEIEAPDAGHHARANHLIWTTAALSRYIHLEDRDQTATARINSDRARREQMPGLRAVPARFFSSTTRRIGQQAVHNAPTRLADLSDTAELVIYGP